MTTSMIRHLRIFGRHIKVLCASLHWLQSNAPDVRVILRILSVSMPALPQQEGKGQHKNKECLCRCFAPQNNMSLTFN